MTKLLRVHGSENTFYILDQTLLENPLTNSQLTNLAKQFCVAHDNLDRADGILVVENSKHPNCLGKMTVVNADGSRASMCGNGLRCVARYLSEKFEQEQFFVETQEADLKVSKQTDLAKNVTTFSVEISPVSFDRKTLPFDNLDHEEIINKSLPALSNDLKFTAISVPNPHLISFVTNDKDLNETLGKLGKRLNGDNPYFPDGVNVNFAKILGSNKLFVRTFERGVGFTNACGTGMSATSLAFAINYPNLVNINEPIEVYNPGGMVKTIVHLNDPKWIELIGNATFTKKIEIPEKLLHEGIFDLEQIKILDTGEEKAYQTFIKSLNSEEI